MRIWGIDPGKTIGACLYEDGRVVDAVEFADISELRQYHVRMRQPDIYAVEWPRIYGIGGNDIADTCAQAGWIWAEFGADRMPAESGWFRNRHALTRQQVVGALSAKIGELVRADAGVWAALLALHGGKGVADAKDGPLYALKGKPHAKAACAVAWTAMELVKYVAE